MSDIVEIATYRVLCDYDQAEIERLRTVNAKILAALKLALTQDHLDRNILDAINAAIAAADPRQAD